MIPPPAPDKLQWSRLNHLQVGRYAEYLAKMEFTLCGFDVYTSEVDDKGIDFVVRRDPAAYFDIQVKSLRGPGYVFFRKDCFELRANLFAALALFQDGRMPNLYLIPSLTWQAPNKIFVNRDYVGKKSLPEWGLNISRKNLSALEPHRFAVAVERLRHGT